MNEPALNPVPVKSAQKPVCFLERLSSSQGKLMLLLLAACFSVPACFTGFATIGLDPSWQSGLELAAMQGKEFGREYIFTYGPLGWLLIHLPVNKLGLLLYDFFILGSLISIYRQVLPEKIKLGDAVLVIGLAIVTKIGLGAAPAGVLFTVLCYWLWRVYDNGNALSVACCMASALILFFSKVNYGLIMIVLVPSYGIGLLLLHRERRVAGLHLLLGFPILVWLGAIIWHVNLPAYLRSALELIVGYNEAMVTPVTISLFGFELACLFLVAMGCVAFFGRHRLLWTGQVMILPLIGLASMLLFKNAFVRADEGHIPSFGLGLPLLLSVWGIAWKYQPAVRSLLAASLIYPLALLVAENQHFGRNELVKTLPLRYVRGVFMAPWRESYPNLQYQLRAHYPKAVLSGEAREAIGKGSVDVMPWECSIPILNGLNYKGRPVPQSYSVYTPWLDAANARFISSHEAPDNILYSCAQESSIDERPAAWDESLTKRTLLENYTFDSEFKLPMRVWQFQDLEPADVFLLKHTPGVRRLIPLLTNEVSLNLNQVLNIPVTTNLIFLTLTVDRTILGRVKSFMLSPSMLTAAFSYQDGSLKNYRAVLPILKTGVLINRRVESPDELRNWLQIMAEKNTAVSSVSFKSSSAWSFKREIKGELVEYRIVSNTNTALVEANLTH